MDAARFLRRGKSGAPIVILVTALLILIIHLASFTFRRNLKITVGAKNICHICKYYSYAEQRDLQTWQSRTKEGLDTGSKFIFFIG